MKKIIYQMLPRLWGKGKFRDVDNATLGYIKGVGADFVWLTGMPRHATGLDFVKGDPGSPYAVEDWYDVNPYMAVCQSRRLGEFKSLVRRAHACGLGVITDFIPNHVAVSYRGGLPLHGWHDGDWTDTVKVNWDDGRAVAEFCSVLRFWASLGVDGFRCDMVELVDSSALGRVISALKVEYPELIFVAEVYDLSNYDRYLAAGFDLLYDKSGSYDILRGIVEGRRSARELTWNWQRLGASAPRMLNFLENHDEQRVPYWAGVSAGRPYPWAAVAYSMLFNDASFMLYFGQEVGEDAAEGHEGRTSIFSWCRPAGVTRLHDAVFAGDLYDGSAGDSAFLEKYRGLLELASSEGFRCGGNWDLCYCQSSPSFDPERHFAFLRFTPGGCYAVFCNFASNAVSLDLFIPQESGAGRSSCHIDACAGDFCLIRL